MPVVLSPALAVIYIQYAKKALAKPYRDFERFEIFSTLLEELDPLEPYEVHRRRIELDSRSEVIEALNVRRELYEQWAQSARTARRPGNKEWNKYIAFVNAQLKFHIDLNYDQFCFLCDAMAGFRLSSLPANKKRSIFWGCVLRREWRFARIKLLIDSRERLEDFIGTIQTTTAVCGTDLYIAHIGAGLEVPVIPTSAEHQIVAISSKTEDKQALLADGEESLRVTGTEIPDSANQDSLEESEDEYESIFAEAKDVMALIRALQQLGKNASEQAEQDVSDSIHQLSGTITKCSDEMKQFGYLLQKRLENIAGSDDGEPSVIHEALTLLALAAQGQKGQESEDTENSNSVDDSSGLVKCELNCMENSKARLCHSESQTVIASVIVNNKSPNDKNADHISHESTPEFVTMPHIDTKGPIDSGLVGNNESGSVGSSERKGSTELPASLDLPQLSNDLTAHQSIETTKVSLHCGETNIRLIESNGSPTFNCPEPMKHVNPEPEENILPDTALVDTGKSRIG